MAIKMCDVVSFLRVYRRQHLLAKDSNKHTYTCNKHDAIKKAEMFHLPVSQVQVQI